MSLREEVEVTKIETYPAGQIAVTKKEIIYKNDEVVSDKEVIRIYNPGESIEESDSKVKNIARAIWTQELINTYKRDSQETFSNN
jgi:hypothetical protein